ncbi:thioredoxin-coupled arsenate reductase; skin element [Oenococcus oeni]|uniref:arsenate reductase (thioredoxin) n=1 Tax=Oenococcus oeni TaxID=1247 RepID=UPI0010AF56D5|nr:arsenate reductase (thioredoxin) [Oenococcus oeni]SYW03307.1 thioredoxin-coupled arsenate reductase; skin element [Oenococcus oeni]
MKKIYFLCTGNSARSQMAEGFAKKYLSSDWEIQSAGVEKHGLNPFAVKVMQQLDIDISKQYSKLIDNNYLQQCQLIVTLCGDARDRCPMTPASIKKIHWELIDPAQASGTEEEKIHVFEMVRDEIKDRVMQLSKEI